MKGKAPADKCAHHILRTHEQFTVQCPFPYRFHRPKMHQQCILKSAKYRSRL